MLDALILGMEVSGRIGNAYRTSGPNTYFLPTTIVGGFGATAASCRLLGLDVDQTVDALGIYYAQTSGNRQALIEQKPTKRTQPGFAVRSAMWSACLAKRGLTGAEEAFEGAGGLFGLYTGEKCPPIEMFSGPLDAFHIETITIKRFPTCGSQQTAMLAALKIASEHKLRPEDIQTVEIFLAPGGDELVGRAFVMTQDPQIDAQFCAPYGVALALLRGRVLLSDITNEQIQKDIEVSQLAERIIQLNEWPEPIEAWEQAVRVTTTDGRTLSAVAHKRRDIFNPDLVTDENVERKFRECVEFAGVCSETEASEIVQSMRAFDQIDDVSAFVVGSLVFQ